MIKIENISYFLLPHMTLSEGDFRNLCIFPPTLKVLEIVRQASIPEWAQKTVSGGSVLSGTDLFARIGSCLDEYRAFAQIHGGPGGILGFLSQVRGEIDEPRFRIQEELRGKCPPGMDTAGEQIVRSALFLEIARELDEKELEIQSGYGRLNAIEREFRNILGIEDEESELAEAYIAPALSPDTNGLLYMLPSRIENWFRLFSLKPLESMPVFVARFPEVMRETLEMIRAGCERDGKEFSTAAYLLGSVPTLDGLGAKQFRTLIEAPGMIQLLSSCHNQAENFIRRAACGEEDPDELQSGSRLLQNIFEKFCRQCDVPEGNKLNLHLTVLKNATLADVTGLFGANTGSDAALWPPVFLSVASA